MTMEADFAEHFALERAIDAAWRRMRSDTCTAITIGEFVDQVLARCPSADAAYVRSVLKRRLEGYRPRPRRRRGREA